MHHLFWSGPHKPNWGDILNIHLYKEITGKDPKWKDYNSKESYYMSIGSVLEKATPHSIIWGSGFMHADGVVKSRPLGQRFRVHAVRGPLSREKLLQQGIPCPAVYGDPALLYPKFYNPTNIQKRYKYGIIPHYVDWDHELVNKWKERESEGVKVINILGEDVNSFVDQVLECEVILSSSLHGIICGDAYGIPSYWIKLSDDVLGNGFKFKDYFESVNRLDNEPLNWKGKLKGLKLKPYQIDIDLDKLLNACPYKK